VDEAFRTFNTVITSARGTDWAAKALEETAKLHEVRRNRTGAQQARDALLRDYPDSPTTIRVWSSIADRHYQSGQFKEAVAIYEQLAPSLRGNARQQFESAKAIVESGGNPSRLLIAANQALKNNRRELAKNLYQLIAGQRTSPQVLAEARVKYAWCLYSDGGPENLAEAEKIWSSIASQEPKSEWGGQSRWHLVQLHAGPKREWQKAVEMCAAIARDFPAGSFRHEQALYTRAWLLRTHKQWQEANVAFEDLVRYYPAKASHPPIIRYMEEITDGLARPSQASNR
jgi:tetratricopeptide (TPR) repeat protein